MPSFFIERRHVVKDFEGFKQHADALDSSPFKVDDVDKADIVFTCCANGAVFQDEKTHKMRGPYYTLQRMSALPKLKKAGAAYVVWGLPHK